MLTFNKFDSVHHFSHTAMATLFDFFIIHENVNYAQQAAWEIVKEIDRLENELSRFKPNSDISRINNLKAGEKIILSIDTFNCISRSIEYYHKTKNSFNIACGALLKCWRNPDYTLKNPTDEEVKFATNLSKIENLVLHAEDYSIEVTQEGTIVDLGAFGKGYAIDLAANILHEWNIESALLSAGRSSIKAIGNPPNLPGWNISISNPDNQSEVIKTFSLTNISVGASGLGKGFHIINTLTGKPESSRKCCWVFSDNCANADALSTSFMILGNEDINKIIESERNISAIVLNETVCGDYAINIFGSLPKFATQA